MPVYGYKLSSEEHGPRDLVRFAQRAEEIGFTFAAISDHFHPWTDQQGHSPFVWGVLGAVAQATERIEVITGVTAPIIRTHPAIVAHAAATCAQLFEGRFSFGLGTGEHLNEHVLGDKWPRAGIRRAMLEEAIEVMRKLWKGENTNHSGRFYTVENARIYDAPEQPIPLLIAASGDKALALAGKKGDGLISLAPDSETVGTFDEAGGRGKPKYAEIQNCWAGSDDEALETTLKWWPNIGAPGETTQELPLPRHFEQVGGSVTADDIKDKLAYGPDVERHVAMVRKYTDAGYTHIWMHQIGPDQEGFMRFCESELLPTLA